MSWQKLKKEIQSITPDKFEDLIAELLSLALKQPFVVARKGDQPSGDARNLDGDVSMQAKRYTGKTSPNAKLVEGDIRQVIRSLPHLQVYVLAVSRDTAQLHDTLDAISEETGLDIVILGLNDGISDIGALCVEFWEDICNYFDKLNSDEENWVWVEKMKNDSETKQKLEKVKLKLDSGIQSQYNVKNDVEKCLSERFSRNEGYNPINLSQAIDRHEIESSINHWWKRDDVPICFLQGEEGTGKTWLAAKWMKSIHESENIVTFWLDSKDWNGCKSIFDLLKNCLSAIYVSNKQERIPKLQNKAAKIWRNTLIVLDGVNERDAIEASQTILNEYFQPESDWKDRIRFLFTTRQLDDYPHFIGYLWGKCHKISVSPYNASELNEVLSRKGMQQHDLPDSLKEIAIIPRYFQRCIELKDELGSFEVITKEMILLADLQYKIKHSDLQIRENLGWTRVEDLNDFLSHLAQQIEWDKIEDAPKVPAKLLKECFEDYTNTRIDLEEQHIANKAGQFHAVLNADHVLLCWALYLSRLFDCMEFAEVTECARDFQDALEPIPSEDLRTEALFIALQISALSTESDISHIQLSQKRAALMLAWFNSHNAQITKERIDFWVERDTNAYAQVVEFEFKKDILPNEEEVLIEPLAKTWQNKKGQLNHLESRMKKWLLPTYTDENIESNEIPDSDNYPKPNLYFTQNHLAIAALSILSQRPERQFLHILAQCYAIFEHRPQLEQNKIRIREYIGKIMRWGFSETVIGDLYWLAELAQSDDYSLKGLITLSDDLQVVELPHLLQLALFDHPETYTRRSIPLRKDILWYIRNHELLLPDDSPKVNLKRSYEGLDCFAVRTDLPDLCDDDLVKIKEVLQYISENAKLGTRVGASREDFCIQNLLPWVAKNDHEEYAELACNLKLNTLNQPWAQFKLLSIQGLIFNQEDCTKIAEAILGMKEQLTQAEEFYSDIVWLTHLLTELLLFCSSEEMLIDWFLFLASQESLRSSICYESLPYLLEDLLPASIIELATEKLEGFRSSTSENQNQSENSSNEFSEEEFWCALFAYGSKIEIKSVNYALEDLKMREPNSIGTFPMMRLAYSDPKRILKEILNDENIQQHIYSKNGRSWMMHTYDGNDVPSYELLRSYLPTEIIGSFLCAPERRADLSRWGKDLFSRLFSILEGTEGDSNTLEDVLFGINRRALQIWAEQDYADFLHLSDIYLRNLSKAPFYQQILSDFTDSIHCLLLRFQPENAMNLYRQWRGESVRTIHYNEFGIETFIAQLWKVEQCNSQKHVELRRSVLEDYQNDEETMFMTIAAMAGGGKQELLNLVTQEYLMSSYAKERNLGVSILPWFGSGDAIEILEDLKKNDPSLWVRGHAAWAYEIAQQERSCREVYKEALQSQDLFRISAVFEQIRPALTPTAKWWHCQIEEEEGFYEQSQINPKFLAIIMRFWHHWGKSSNTRHDITVFDKKLSEYCRGEKLGFGSPPRLAPWWKPE